MIADCRTTAARPVPGGSMRRHRRRLRIFALSFLAVPLAAQEGVLRCDRPSVEEGLSHSTVRAIHQDTRDDRTP